MIPSYADPADRVTVIGFTWAPRSHEVRDFLARALADVGQQPIALDDHVRAPRDLAVAPALDSARPLVLGSGDQARPRGPTHG